jgi:hypothetical protein
MWHTCAYFGNIALTSTNQPINALADNVFKIGSQNGFVLQEDMMLLGAYAGGIGISNPALKSPKLNQFNPLIITPSSLTQAVANAKQKALWPYRPFTFRNQEEVTATVDNTNAGAQNMTLVTDFSNGIDPVPNGEELFVRFSSTTTAVANAWTLLTFTLTQTLPEGVYALIGSEIFSTTGIAHRYTLWGQFYRPGFPSSTAQSNLQSDAIQTLQMGMGGQFSNVTLPNIEVLCSAADAAFTGFMRVIKVR